MPNQIDTALDPKDKLVADLRVVVSDAEELLAATASQTGEKIAELRSRMQDNLHGARIKLADAEAAVRERTRQVAKATDNYVHENPWKAIGIAAGIGVVVGLLISRR